MTNKIKWFTESLKISELKSYEKNPRKMSAKEKEDIKNSIDDFGRVVPLVINTGSRKNIVIGGNQRLKIYKELKIEKVEVMIPSRELSLEEEQELNIRLNKNTASWDYELLRDMDIDLLLDVGFEDDELQGFFDDVELSEDNFDLKKALKETTIAKVKTGEIWQLGKHKLLVGDSTDKKEVERLMNGAKAHVVYQDPPYNIGLDYGKGIGNKKEYGGSFSSKDDSKSDFEYKVFLEESIEASKNIAEKDAHYFYWCDAKYIGAIQTIYKQNKIIFRRLATWVKNNQNPTPKIAFNRVTEMCVYGTFGKPYLNNDFKNANELLNQELSSGNKLHDELFEMMDLWIVKRENSQEYTHPTMKPVSLNEKPLKRCSAPGQNIFSGFGGSGSDLIACEQLNRKWFGVEQDHIFATIIIERWEKFTNQKAKKI